MTNDTLKATYSALLNGDFSDEIQAQNFRATYSPEDNKIRLYAESRLSAELYQLVREFGFKYAPIQKLFVAPSWTPQRLDLCLLLVTEIEPEGVSLAERAEAKIIRLEALADKREGQAAVFQEAAQRIAEGLDHSQPILIGHHSERRARKGQDRLKSANAQALKAHEAVDYWNYRAVGVGHNVNRKGSVRTTLNRIKKLLADLRSQQRKINEGQIALDRWLKIEAITDDVERKKAAVYYCGFSTTAPSFENYKDNYYNRLEREEISADEVIKGCIDYQKSVINSPIRARWIAHILNRLSYERQEIGTIPRFDGELTPVILQAFARENGADKPKATASEKGFVLKSSVDLPLHLSEGCELDLTADQWCDLMQSVGYSVVIKERRAPKKQTCPLINPTPEQAEKLQALWNAQALKKQYGKTSESLELPQKMYSARSGGSYSPFETIELDAQGHRIWRNWQTKNIEAVCRVRVGPGSQTYSADRAIIISDKPQKTLPVSFEAKLQQVEA